ncbi:Flavin mononucleotide hydrolase 1, chloroplatic [Gracilariopsis chorda]|uniref:Flavin mononucleotide hydrolase 1, chloroplatic n=1 Tax=Gracilariopsis chorda TaxID=448386 RepID=A0A2V3IY47_9FLOR|nr:Flavin mononucleotide hydrolase 1, chloroplatic [Gracilariopsis chorda]|eukprot:PXF47041.1 Flavin mononucleotide hydrolase 1, chloroplatic [Gracilariopsis chorda]
MTLKPIGGKPITQNSLNSSTCAKQARPPIIVSDVLDTLVVDPFFNGMAAHFGFENFSDFVSAKTPDVWVNFELGHISEAQLAEQFFKDRRPVNLPSFKNFLRQSYRMVPGTDLLLNTLRKAHIEVHLCSNYPIWDDLIEETVQLHARYGARWTFVSGKEGVRKPDATAYQRVAAKAGVDLSSCVLLDDREKNCEGALEAGYLAAIHFRDAKQAVDDLAEVLADRGVTLDISTRLMP